MVLPVKNAGIQLRAAGTQGRLKPVSLKHSCALARWRTVVTALFAGCWAYCALSAGLPSGTDAILREALTIFRQGDQNKALDQVSHVIAAHPDYAQAYYVRGQIHSAMDHHEKAIADYDQSLSFDPKAFPTFQQRGCEHFFLGHIDKSLEDFDKYLQLAPAQAPYHWQRGISLYYAGRFEDGRKQFELHQTVNPNDVENAVWHFLCVARQSGIAKARELLIPISGDGRVPMMQVHALFAQKAKPEDVLAAAREGETSTGRVQQQLFYAYLYLGLYYEALGDQKLTREYIFKAADMSKPYNYMGAVARVHAAILRKATEKPAGPKEK